MGLAGGLLFLLLVLSSPKEARADHYYYHTLHEVHYQHRYPYPPSQIIIIDGRPIICVPCSFPSCFPYVRSNRHREGTFFRNSHQQGPHALILESR